jgi:hypothetical protein
MRHGTPIERAECVRLYSQGVLLKHLVELFNRPRPTLNRWIREADAKRGHKFRGQWLALPQAERGENAR